MKGKSSGAPRIISWNITLRCPLKCSHCYVDAGDDEAEGGGRYGDCTYRDLCGGGCRVRAHAVEGNFMAEDPFCFLVGDAGSLEN